jgi:6-phosphogluconolactonase
VSHIEVLRFDTAEDLLKSCCADVVQFITATKATLSRKPRLVLTGGRLGQGLVSQLALPESSFDSSSVWITWGDERLVPAESSESNSGEALRRFPGLALADIFRYPTSQDLLTCRNEADAELAAILEPSGSADPLFDLVLLGIGEDGHVASIFPNEHAALAGPFGLIAATDRSPKPPASRLTLTEFALNRSRAVWFMAAGAEKGDAVALSLTGGDSVPAGRVRGIESTRWYLDKAAAEAV